MEEGPEHILTNFDALIQKKNRCLSIPTEHRLALEHFQVLAFIKQIGLDRMLYPRQSLTAKSQDMHGYSSQPLQAEEIPQRAMYLWQR